MPTPPQKQPDRFYNFRKTNVVFAWSSLALLATTIWMVVDDYAKPWKRHQSVFREMEAQKLEQEAAAERQRLNEAEINQAREAIAQEAAKLEGRRDEIVSLEKQIEGLDKDIYEADVTARTTKSILDTERFKLDQATQGGNPDAIARQRAVVDELTAKLREEQKVLESYTQQRDDARAAIATQRAGVDAAEERLAGLRSELDGLERRADNLAKDVPYFLLNFPLMDFIEPDLKIEQVVLSGLFHNINFVNIDRVDRCVTCHVAAIRPGFEGEEWPNPYKSHPRLDLFVGDTSPHPYTRYGCTVCHGGLDRATDFARAGHSPTSEEQRAEWKREYGWKPQKYLDTPILPANYSEAGCVSCHSNEIWTPQSQVQDAGRELISRMGCFTCHKIDLPSYEDMPRPGPSLKKVASKIDPGFAYRWIEAPRDFRPTTFMPHFFFQENIEGELNEERQRVEIAALVAFLWDVSETEAYPPAPRGDAQRGAALFESVGCTGCHIRDAEATRDQFFPEINRLHGPNLIGAGSKLSAGWVYAWLKEPKAYNPTTRMPSLRLTDQEAADLTAFVMSSRNPDYEGLQLPGVDPEVRDGLVVEYLQNNYTIEQSHARLEAMSAEERDVYLGEQTIQKYGCYACHDIEGFDDAKPIGVELTAEGSKPVHQFDFGHVHDVPHTRHDWIKTKLLRPRIWDHGKELNKTYGELYKMPNFGMSEREAEAITANVLGFTEEGVVTERKAAVGERGAALAAGRRLVTQYNCRGCHLLEDMGHAIRTAIEDPGMLPPNLAAQGARVQSEWLFDYLHDPGSVSMRPWLSVRMPTFGFSDEQVNTIVQYFAAREERTPFLSPHDGADPRELAVGREVFGMLQCARCHPAGPAAASALGINAAELAPSLLLARERLRHDWVDDWIKDPQSWVSGTKMPSNFPPLPDGGYMSPIVNAIDSPRFAEQKARMLRYFDSEEELKAYLGDVDRVTGALRDHIWTLR